MRDIAAAQIGLAITLVGIAHEFCAAFGYTRELVALIEVHVADLTFTGSAG